MEEPLNPAHPSSVGALIAEEWTIDPFSTLPSFAEMVMIDEATRSEAKATGAALDSMELFLTRRLRLMELEDYETFTQSGRWSRYVCQPLTALRKWRYTCANTMYKFLRRYKLEFQYLAIYLLERRCIKYTGSSVAESLYGGKRVKLGGRVPRSDTIVDKDTVSLVDLSPRDKTRAALLIALVPYLHHRLHRICMQRATLNDFTLWTIYEPLRVALATFNLICRWQFLVGKSFHYDLSSKLLQQIVRRITQADSLANVSSRDSTETEKEASIDNKERTVQEVSNNPNAVDKKSQFAQSVLLCISASLAMSWLTQIRHEWNNYRRDELLLQQPEQQVPDGSDRELPTTIPPPPPPGDQLTNSTVPVDRCPLCRRHHSKPTASTSGFVFCLSCVMPYVRKHGKCPVSGTVCNEERLTRLFEPDEAKQV